MADRKRLHPDDKKLIERNAYILGVTPRRARQQLEEWGNFRVCEVCERFHEADGPCRVIEVEAVM